MASMKYFFSGPTHWTGQSFFPPRGDSDYPDYKVVFTQGLPFYLLTERENLISNENKLIHSFILTDPSRYPDQIPSMVDAFSVLEKTFRIHLRAVGSVRAWLSLYFSSETEMQPVHDQVRGMRDGCNKLRSRLAKELREIATILEGEIDVDISKDGARKE